MGETIRLSDKRRHVLERCNRSAEENRTMFPGLNTNFAGNAGWTPQVKWLLERKLIERRGLNVVTTKRGRHLLEEIL